MAITSVPIRSGAVATLILTLLCAPGCTTSNPPAPKEERAAYDPWEPLNRRVYSFNDTVDRFTFKPLAKGYEKVFPKFIRTGINNFSKNLRTPLHIINNLLQGKVVRSISETGRFIVNSTAGIGGLVDAGSVMGFETYREDFGQTLAVWGLPAGPYVVLPILGPQTFRNATMIPLVFAVDPLYYLEHDRTRRTIYFVRAVDVRAGLFAAEALIEDSYDRYLTIRESLLQNREFLIYDGDPPEDEDFYDDFQDFEDEDFEDEGVQD